MRRRFGLTLLELVVVLSILAALGGLVLPLVRGYRNQATEGSSIDAVRELTKLAAEVEQSTTLFPNRMESLLEGGTTLFTKLPSTVGLSPVALSANQVAALADKGITQVMDANGAANDSATFDSTAALRSLVAGGNVTQVAHATVFRQLGKTPGTQLDGSGNPVSNIFVVFGVGMQCSLVGSYVAEAPFRVPESSNPHNVYARFGLVFEIPGSTSVGTTIFLIGAVAFDARTESDGNLYSIRGVQSLADDFYTVD